MCVARLQEGQKEPACAATCPSGAIQFGKRDDMLTLAHERIASEPDRYVDHVFGEHENGGTSTFYISPVPFDKIGFPAVQTTQSPRSSTVWQPEKGLPS